MSRSPAAGLLASLREDAQVRTELAVMLGIPAGLPEALNRLADELRAQRAETTAQFELVRQRFEASDRRLEDVVRRFEARFEAIDKRFEEMDRRFEARFAAIDKRFEQMDRRFEQMDRRFEQMDKRFEQMDKRFEQMVGALTDVRREVGALAENVGFGLEDIGRVVLPGYLERHAGLRVDKLERRFVRLNDREWEIDLFGEGIRGGKPIAVIGECRSRIYRSDAVEFLGKIDRFRDAFPGEIQPVLFGYLVHPSAEEVATSRGVLLVSSYQR
ncbi:MAG: hypothetical protein HY905_11030 [Deltaproteobacteria bacterium]|nr:hypothetical protein [Deltaproteobacteria bacterium]